MRFGRLLNPRSIAVVGGQWAESVITQCRQAGFDGEVWPVHPRRNRLAGEPCYASLDDLPGVPDATFIAVNNEQTIELVASLAAAGAGGAICFATGFGERAALDRDAEARQRRLTEAAGDMPLIGPNSYGLLNYLDGISLWPDQHGGKAVERGVAVITQSSNIAINLSMQRRGLPLAYLITAGNQAQTTLAELAASVLEDDRVTALGLHIEGFSDIRAFESLAGRARAMGKRIVVLKTGVTSLARAALMSHTRSLSGDDAAASAFIERLGLLRSRGIGEFIETLKVLHLPRKVGGYRVLSMTSSGGEAALVGDFGANQGLQFPRLDDDQKIALKQVLGGEVALANPLDYHMAIRDDRVAMERMVVAMLQCHEPPPSATISANDQFPSPADVALLVLDFPRSDRCDQDSWQQALDAFLSASQHWQGVRAVIATLAENMPEEIVEALFRQDVVALCGLNDGLRALANAGWLDMADSTESPLPVWLPDNPDVSFKAAALSLVEGAGAERSGRSARRASQEAWGLVHSAVTGRQPPRQLDESTAKRWLNRFGISVPVSVRLSFADVRSSLSLSRALDKASPAFSYPVVAKSLGVLHKSDANAIALAIGNRRELERAIREMDCEGGCLIEEQVDGAVVELLVSVVQDPVHGLLMTIGAGGVATEVLADTVHCLIPATRAEFDRRIDRLRCAPLLNGFRNRAAVDRDRLLDTLESVQQAALQLGERLVELEINPLLCSAETCTAVDAFVAVRGSNLPG
ncbi:acetate--CoA ligase family protein [Granulosicoccus sp. 3-233]|uniref:acetate--CoA ligase family protein n=1 Tax=Granulosicoccus sp. 3-233 TaxID=3417969 RepID=UPI003D34220C